MKSTILTLIGRPGSGRFDWNTNEVAKILPPCFDRRPRLSLVHRGSECKTTSPFMGYTERHIVEGLAKLWKTIHSACTPADAIDILPRNLLQKKNPSPSQMFTLQILPMASDLSIFFIASMSNCSGRPLTVIWNCLQSNFDNLSVVDWIASPQARPLPPRLG